MNTSRTRSARHGAQVVCTGREDQLSDCVFPEEFGDAVSTDNPESASGLSAGCGARDGEIFGVVCRRFDVTGVYPYSCFCSRLNTVSIPGTSVLMGHPHAGDAFHACSKAPSKTFQAPLVLITAIATALAVGYYG